MLKLRELRLEKGVSQDEVADALKVKNYTIGNWERNRAEPNISALVELADYFGCSLDYLLGREDDVGNVTVMGAELNANEQRLVDCFRSLSEDGKATFLDMAENIASMYRAAPKSVPKIS